MSKNTLLEMLRYRRPDNSKGEKMFIRRFLLSLPDYKVDAYGNIIFKIGDSPIMWSSHTDTVHHKQDKQKISVDDKGWAFATEPDVLGADCATGVYIMREMILRKVPGLYIFHRAEEVGGKGSNHIAARTPDLVKDIKYAIAFDRKGFDSVITHQFTGRCCSDAFADSLIAQFTGKWQKDDGGSFTDTANYTDLIGECTNVSIGYLSQHTNRECQHIDFALAMPEMMSLVKPELLVSERKPGETDYSDYGYGYHRFGSSIYHGGWSHVSSEYDYVEENHDNEKVLVWRRLTSNEKEQRNLSKLIDAIKQHPVTTARILYEHGFSSRDIYERNDKQRGSHPHEDVEQDEEEDENVERTSAY